MIPSAELTVACVWVQGNVPYSSEYVVRLKSMCERFLPFHRFVCLTDRPNKLPSSIHTVSVDALIPQRAWWTKVKLFDPNMPFSGRVLYLDLDILIVRHLLNVVAFSGDVLTAIPHAGNFHGRDGLAVFKRLNSSVMTWNAGDYGELWTKWNPEVARRLWGDQDWLGEQLEEIKLMPLSWFPRLSEVARPPWPSRAHVVLCKKPKNHEMAAQHEWFSREWR